MALEPMHRGDTKPHWVATVSVNGVTDDLTGDSFQVKIKKGSATLLTKTTGITGATGGVVTVAWSGTDIDIPSGKTYRVLLYNASEDWTVEDSLQVLDA